MRVRYTLPSKKCDFFATINVAKKVRDLTDADYVKIRQALERHVVQELGFSKAEAELLVILKMND